MNCKKNVTVHIVRHGLSAGNVPFPGFAFDEKNPPLMPLGHIQARRVADRFRPGEIGAIYASPLLRAVQTAYPAAERTGLPVLLLPALCEKDTPAPFADIGRVAGEYPLCRVFSRSGFPAGEESPDEALGRACAAVKTVLDNARDGDTVLLFSHGTFSSYLFRAMLDIREMSFRYKCDNCSVTTVRFYDDGSVKLCYMNDVRHLKEDEIT